MQRHERISQLDVLVDSIDVRVRAVSVILKDLNRELVVLEKLRKACVIGNDEYVKKKASLREKAAWAREQIGTGQGFRSPISRPGRWDRTWLVDLRYFLPPHYRESFRGDVNEIARELDLKGYGRLRRFAVLALHAGSVLWAAIKSRLGKYYRRKS